MGVCYDAALIFPFRRTPVKIRHVSRFLALTAIVALGACAPAAPEMNAQADITAVNALRSSFVAAFNANDADAIGNLYAADAVRAGNHQPTASGRPAIIAADKAAFAQMAMRIELTPEETKTMGSFGFDRGTYKMTIAPKAAGAPMNDEGRYLVLLEKGADGAWKVSRDIDNSSMPMPMPPPPDKGKGK
jgi:uncharacterized protein (TIGR02246 family)